MLLEESSQVLRALLIFRKNLLFLGEFQCAGLTDASSFGSQVRLEVLQLWPERIQTGFAADAATDFHLAGAKGFVELRATIYITSFRSMDDVGLLLVLEAVSPFINSLLQDLESVGFLHVRGLRVWHALALT